MTHIKAIEVSLEGAEDEISIIIRNKSIYPGEQFIVVTHDAYRSPITGRYCSSEEIANKFGQEALKLIKPHEL